jgi:FAD synthase
LEEALSKSDQQLKSVMKERDDLATRNKRLEDASTKPVQQLEMERNDLDIRNKQLEEFVQKFQVQADNLAKKV